MDPAAVRHALRDALEQQLALDDPPETKATFERLLRSGIPEEEAWRLLSVVLLGELNEIMRSQRSFDRARYVAALRALPRTPEGTGAL